MRLSLAALLGTLALAGATLGRPDPEPAEQWTQLFNGKDLTGWTPKIRYQNSGEDPKKTFRVADGMIQVRYDNYDDFGAAFGHLFYDKPLSHYRLRVEYRFVGEQCKGGQGWATRNSGIMLHGQTPESMAIDQDFPVSAEAQLLGGLGKGKRATNNLCTPGTNVVYKDKLYTPHCLNSASETYNGDQWVTAEVEVHGSGKVKHLVNGKVVLEYEQVQYDPKDANARKLIKKGAPLLIESGTISLQSESHPCDFRKVELLLIKK